MAVTRATQGVRRGARGSRIVDSVLAATLAELSAHGYAAFTIEGVANAAGVNRTTIYRRWPDRASLMGAALQPLLARYDGIPDTGSALGDLSAVMRTVRDNLLSAEGRAFSEAVKANAEELREVLDAATQRALRPFREVLSRAAMRGDVDDAGVDVLAHLGFSGVAMWAQSFGRTATDDECEEMARLLLLGAGAAEALVR